MFIAKMDEIESRCWIFAASLIILLCCITKWLSKHGGNYKNLPPSPPTLPILGNLHQLGTIMPRQNLQRLAEKYSPLMLLHLGGVRLLVVSSADAAREVLKTNDPTFASRPQMTRLGFDNTGVVFAPYGEYWKQGKKIYLLQLLSKTRVQSLRSVVEEEAALFIQKIRESSAGTVDLSAMFAKFSNDVICRSAFGRKKSESGGSLLTLMEKITEILGSVSIGEFLPWLSWMDRVSGFNEKAKMLAKEVDDFLEGVIQDHIEGENGDNFLDIMLQIYRGNTEGLSMDRSSIKAMILDIFAAGTDTTSTTLEWAMTQLLRHPPVMEKLQKEIREIVKDKHVITSDDIEKMHYLKAVIKETLRLHPPLPLIPRLATRDVIVKGYYVSAGTMVMINARAIGRDPSRWEDPEIFDPDRFFNSSIDFKGKDFELIPFGAGRRVCPAIGFSVANMELLLAYLMQKFNWKLPNGEEGKDLDMSESLGFTTPRLVPLLTVASPIE